jgi:hypothetical protein
LKTKGDSYLLGGKQDLHAVEPKTATGDADWSWAAQAWECKRREEGAGKRERGREEGVEGSGAGAVRDSPGQEAAAGAGQTCQQSRYGGLKKRSGGMRGEEEVEGWRVGGLRSRESKFNMQQHRRETRAVA